MNEMLKRMKDSELVELCRASLELQRATMKICFAVDCNCETCCCRSLCHDTNTLWLECEKEIGRRCRG